MDDPVLSMKVLTKSLGNLKHGFDSDETFRAPVIPEYFRKGFLAALVTKDEAKRRRQDKLGVQVAMCLNAMNEMVDAWEAFSGTEVRQEAALAKLVSTH